MKKDKVQKKFLDALEKTPIIQSACNQMGISRNTFYRWINEDDEFRELVDDRLSIGIDLVNDYAESNVLNGIKNGDAGYTKYWLSARHYAYQRPLIRHYRKQDEIEDRKEREAKEEAKKEFMEWQKGWEMEEMNKNN